MYVFIMSVEIVEFVDFVGRSFTIVPPGGRLNNSFSTEFPVNVFSFVIFEILYGPVYSVIYEVSRGCPSIFSYSNFVPR